MRRAALKESFVGWDFTADKKHHESRGFGPWGGRTGARLQRPCSAGETGASLLEFALTVPILLALVAGAWDFGSAFALKDKMTNAAREAARVSVSNSILPPVGSSATCTSASATPCTIVAAITALQNYLQNDGVNLSCINPNSPGVSGPDPEEYVYTCSSMPGLKIDINRSAVVSIVTSTGPETVQATTVSFTYPVQWWFPIPWSGASTTVTTLHTSVSMANLVF